MFQPPSVDYSMIVGGVVMLITIKPQIESVTDNTTSASNETTSQNDFREFSDSDIRFGTSRMRWGRFQSPKNP